MSQQGVTRRRPVKQKSEFGEFLIGEDRIQRAQLQKALELQSFAGGRLGTNLLEISAMPEGALLDALGRYHQTRTASANELKAISADVIKIVPPKLVRRHGLVPIERTGNTLTLASMEPGDPFLEDEIAMLTSCMVRTVIGLELRIQEAMARYYGLPIAPRLMAVLRRLDRVSRARKVEAAKAEERAQADVPAGQPSSRRPPRPPRKKAPDLEWKKPAPEPEPADTEVHYIEIDEDSFEKAFGKKAPTVEDDPSATTVEEKRPEVEEGQPIADPSPLPTMSAPEPTPVETIPVIPSEAPPVDDPGPSAADPDPSAADPDLSANDQDMIETAAVDPDLIEKTLADLEAERLTAEDPELRLEQAAVALMNSEIRDEIGDVLLAYGAPYLKRRVVFIHRKEQFVGWRGEGEGIRQRSVRAYAVGDKEPSIFLNLTGGTGLWRGPLPPLAANEKIATVLGEPASDCIVLPVGLRGRVVCFLYGDNGTDGVGQVPLPEMRRLVGKAGLAYQVYILKNKIRLF